MYGPDIDVFRPTSVDDDDDDDEKSQLNMGIASLRSELLLQMQIIDMHSTTFIYRVEGQSSLVLIPLWKKVMKKMMRQHLIVMKQLYNLIWDG